MQRPLTLQGHRENRFSDAFSSRRVRRRCGLVGAAQALDRERHVAVPVALYRRKPLPLNEAENPPLQGEGMGGDGFASGVPYEAANELAWGSSRAGASQFANFHEGN